MLAAIRSWWNKRNKEQYPNIEWLNSANAEAAYTPDIIELESKDQLFLFLPCELQEGHTKADLALEGGKPLYKGFTTGKYSLVRNRINQTAVMLPDKKGYIVKGELWVFQPSFITELDKYKLNGVQCERKKVEILIPFSSAAGATYRKVWVDTYEGRPEYWDGVVDGGFVYKSVQLHNPLSSFLNSNSFLYYHYSENFR